jgi:starch synthase
MYIGDIVASGRRLRVLYVAAEAFPLAKTGGLGDVSGALPAALARLGVDIRLMLPGYPQALDVAEDKRVVADLSGDGRLVRGRMPGSDLPVYMFDQAALFQRRGGLYQDAAGTDRPDNHLRYAALCHSAVEVALYGDGTGWKPDLVHASDWHTGLLPALLAHCNGPRPATVFTVHNMAYQGNFLLSVAPDLGVPSVMLTTNGIEFYGQLSFLKAGIRYADRLTTVSPNYAREILTPEYGAGMDGVLRTRAQDLVGILNGVDYDVWDPINDDNLSKCYNIDDISGKAECKAAVQDRLGLERAGDVPLIAFVNRLTRQKMADVVCASLPTLVQQGLQIVLHGEGDKDLEAAFSAAAGKRCPHVIVRIGYEEALAHQLNAGADISLTPSRFEPCGLTTMYAMRYGTLPVTRSTGGPADTVVDDASERAEREGATGFTFDHPTSEQMTACMQRAMVKFRDKGSWQRLQHSAMSRSFGWAETARRYLVLYRELLGPDGVS